MKEKDFPAVEPGDRLRFWPTGGMGARWWTVGAVDDRYVVATSTLPFGQGPCYTVVDLTGFADTTYNGQGNGVVRSSLNTLGGGWDLDEPDSGATILAGLTSGEWELSHRRILRVDRVEVKP